MRHFALSLIATLLFASASEAVVVSRLYDFEPDTPAQAEQVNAELDNIISAINGNLESDNLDQNAVATGNIASYSVTQAKLGPKGQQISSSSDNAQRSSMTEGAIPNMTANLTVVSRPVWVGLQAAGGAAAPGRVTYRHNGGGATDNSAYIGFQRDLVTTNQIGIGARSISSSTDDIFTHYPCSAFWFIDVPDPGPHNYTATYRIATADSGIISVENCKLVVFEL